jgi:geranylgeranyl diphosphate synthase, type II
MNRAMAETPSRPGPDVAELQAAVEDWMRAWLDRRPLPENLRQAVGYALLSPGKRMRPVLVLRSCEAVGGQASDAIVPAAGIEMIHAFSLVHDDLPAMDDDDLRRGRPTLHKHAGEAMAILAGDALLGLAVEAVLEGVEPKATAALVCHELISGCNDMIAGQTYDTLPDFADSVEPIDRLRTTHRNKTGALIRAACRAGAICGGASPAALTAITCYAEAVGLMFQIVDDLLDVTETTEHLGKAAGKDAGRSKLTYPALLGVPASRSEVSRLRDEALNALGPLGPRAVHLRELCEYLVVRTR